MPPVLSCFVLSLAKEGVATVSFDVSDAVVGCSLLVTAFCQLWTETLQWRGYGVICAWLGHVAISLT